MAVLSICSSVKCFFFFSVVINVSYKLWNRRRRFVHGPTGVDWTINGIRRQSCVRIYSLGLESALFFLLDSTIMCFFSLSICFDVFSHTFDLWGQLFLTVGSAHCHLLVCQLPSPSSSSAICSFVSPLFSSDLTCHWTVNLSQHSSNHTPLCSLCRLSHSKTGPHYTGVIMSQVLVLLYDTWYQTILSAYQ